MSKIKYEKEIDIRYNTDICVYANDTDRIELQFDKKSDTLFYVKRIWKNVSKSQRKIQTVFKLKNCYKASRYLIPCVSINGNNFGNGFEPKGLMRDGQNWIFAYDRESIPSCTVTENSDYAVAVFVSDESDASLKSACSISKEEKTYFQEIIHPVKEAPVTYSGRDVYSEAYDEYITLNHDEEFVSGIYISVSKPRWENFGICSALDSALDIFKDASEIVVDNEALWNNSITFAKSLITDYKGKKGFIIGFVLNENGFEYRNDECFELAWCGQNILFCRMLIEDYIKTKNRENLDIALEILGTRVKYCTAKSGLLASQLRDFEDLENAEADTCNLGYGAYELLRCYERLREIGIEKNEYFNAAKAMCDFFIKNYSEKYGFGKQWKLSGECTDEGGTIGAFVICPLCKLYELTSDEIYLETAKKALKFYAERDLDKFCCTAGALDTCCVDKETSAPIIMSGILLYEITEDKAYLEYAEKAAYYFTSWMYHYQPSYDNDSDIAKMNISVKGLTAVSAQHHHLDNYAAIIVPYMRKLAQYTDDEKWRMRSELMWKAALQNISDGEKVIHSHVRPSGSQNEALFHCRWAFAGAKRGDLNDWLVAWPCAFRLSVLADMENKKV